MLIVLVFGIYIYPALHFKQFLVIAHNDVKLLASKKHTEEQHILKHGMREFMVHISTTLAIKIRRHTLMMILISATALIMDIEIYNSPLAIYLQEW